MGLAFFNQQRIQEKRKREELRKASIGAIETDSQTKEILSSSEMEREDTSLDSQELEQEQKTKEPIKVKSKPQTKKAKQNK